MEQSPKGVNSLAGSHPPCDVEDELEDEPDPEPVGVQENWLDGKQSFWTGSKL